MDIGSKKRNGGADIGLFFLPIMAGCFSFGGSRISLLPDGKENSLLKEWSKKYTTLILKRQYRNANYQKKNITDTIEVLIKNY